MAIIVSEEIDAPRDRVWTLITDFDSWADTISGIVAVEVINKPDTGVVGLKWRETRMFFGKEAVETMWISSADPKRWYETTAESHGSVYTTRMSLDESNDKLVLTMQFSAKPTSFMAKVMSLMSFMFNGALRKMMQADLVDIRKVAEKTE